MNSVFLTSVVNHCRVQPLEASVKEIMVYNYCNPPEVMSITRNQDKKNYIMNIKTRVATETGNKQKRDIGKRLKTRDGQNNW